MDLKIKDGLVSRFDVMSHKSWLLELITCAVCFR